MVGSEKLDPLNRTPPALKTKAIEASELQVKRKKGNGRRRPWFSGGGKYGLGIFLELKDLSFLSGNSSLWSEKRAELLKQVEGKVDISPQVLLGLATISLFLNYEAVAVDYCNEIVHMYSGHKILGSVFLTLSSVHMKNRDFTASVENLFLTLDQPPTPFDESDILLLGDLIWKDYKLNSKRLSSNQSVMKKKSRLGGFVKHAYKDAFLKRQQIRGHSSLNDCKTAEEFVDREKTWSSLGKVCLEAGLLYFAQKSFRMALCASDGQFVADTYLQLAITERILGNDEEALNVAGIGFQVSPFDLNLRNYLLHWDHDGWGRYFQAETQSIAAVQNRVRSMIAKKKFQTRLEERRRWRIILRAVATDMVTRMLLETLENVGFRTRAALEIQCTYRRYLGKQALRFKRIGRVKREAAVMIQCMLRVAWSRRHFKACLKTRQFRSEKATIIQSCFRRFSCKLAFLRVRHASNAAREIQRLVRGHIGRNVVKSLRNFCASIIQSIFRGYLVRCGVLEWKENHFEYRHSDQERNSLFGWKDIEWRIQSLTQKDPAEVSSVIRGLAVVSFGPKLVFSDSMAQSILCDALNGQKEVPLSTMKQLLISGTPWEGCCATLAKSLFGAAELNELGISGSFIDLETIQAIFSSIENGQTPNLRVLHLGSIEWSSSNILFSALQFRSLQLCNIHSLHLRNVGLDDNCCRLLSDAFVNSNTLSLLSLGKNQVTHEGFSWILRLLPSLRELDVSENLLGDNAWARFSKWVDSHHIPFPIRKVDFSRNFATNLGAIRIESIMKSTSHSLSELVYIRLDGNPISSKLQNRIIALCEKNLLRSFVSS